MTDITHYAAKGLSGGGASDLDFVDGDVLVDDDVGITIDNGDDNLWFLHRLEAASGATEAVPEIVSPDANAGDKRWHQALLLAGLNMANVQCGQLQFVSATAIKLVPYKGNQAPLYVNGIPRLVRIASAGLTLNTTDARWNGGAVAASTFYLIYLEDSSGTKRLIGSTTAHATDSTTGHEIMSGDVTRTLVGAAYVNASSQFSEHMVLSWHNRRDIVTPHTVFTANRSTTVTGGPAEINAEIRNPFVCWAGAVEARSGGGFFSSTTASVYAHLFFDAVGSIDGGSNMYGTNTAPLALCYGEKLTEGYHFASIAAFVNSGTGTFQGGANASGQRCSLQVVLRG